MSTIVAENLCKTYYLHDERAGWGSWLRRAKREVQALRDVSFRIEPGELVGYIGPNGAGKSTTVKILSGILVPDSGRCEVDGRTPWKERIAHVSRIGVVFGQRTQLWWDLPINASFDLLRDMYQLAQADYRPWRDELIERLDLTTFLAQPVRQLSLGQRMRADLVAAMLHRPNLLFLDEPTIGLDAVSKLAVRAFLRELNRDHGVTTILTTHDLDDIEALCSRVMVIGNGRILSDGSVSALRQEVRDERLLTVDLRRDEPFDPAPAHLVRREGRRVVLRFDPETIASAELIRRITARYEVEDLFLEFTPIEEIVASLYERHREEETS